MHMEMSPTGVSELPNAFMKPSLDIINIRPGSKCGDKNGTPGNCPWCSAKGQTNSLRYYAISLEETILLCTNPVCLYPLVSRPLEDVRASLSKDPVGCKRKTSSLSVGDEISSPLKRLREENLEVSHDLNGCSSLNHTTKTETFTDGLEVLERNGVSVNGSEEQDPEEIPIGPNVDVDLGDKENDGVSSTQNETQEVVEMDIAMETSTELVPLQPHLFWRNEDSLCWLDSLMAMLVNCRTIREARSAKPTPVTLSESAVWNFCSSYDKTCAFVKTKEQQCEDQLTKVPANILEEAERRLSALRSSFFKVLQPALKCEISLEETPVLALPLLLQEDKWARDLFQHTVRWEFKCTVCGYSRNDSVENTLTTLTQNLNDWHPLKATSRIQCSNCNRKNQRATMMLERLSPVFALHFMEGLTKKDLSKYSFEFQGSCYNISTVMQYTRHFKHFVTWIRQSNGSWLELDDLKYPHCMTHKKFTFPPSEIHIVFWEAESRKVDASEICPVTAPSAVTNTDDKLQPKLSDSEADDVCLLSAMSVSEDAELTAFSTLDTSIGSTTLLDTFEGLSHQDIVNLTLVEGNAANQVTDFQIPQSPVIVPAVLPNLPVASSLSSHSASNGSSPSPQKHQRCSSGTKEQSALDSEVILPSVVRSSAGTEKPTPSPSPSAGSNPSGIQHLSLLQRHPCFQSTSVKAPVPAWKPKPTLRCENSEAQPAKPADMFCGFLTKKLPTLPNPPISPQGTTCSTGKVSEIFKSAARKTPSLSKDNQPISTTEALRMKLMKKLKAKKKKLAKLNQLLADPGESIPRPDSTAVTSSTSSFDSPEYDQFFAELLSPATTVSNLSPDSTGLLEILNNQNGETTNGSLQESSTIATVVPEQTQSCNFFTNDSVMNLDNYVLSGMGQTTIENTDFNGLDLFF